MKKRNRERSLVVEGDFRETVRGGLAEEVHVCALCPDRNQLALRSGGKSIAGRKQREPQPAGLLRA